MSTERQHLYRVTLTISMDLPADSAEEAHDFCCEMLHERGQQFSLVPHTIEDLGPDPDWVPDEWPDEPEPDEPSAE